MHIHKNFPLRNYNTFGIQSIAQTFASFSSLQELEELATIPHLPLNKLVILGGGSNILFTSNCEVVFKNEIIGIDVVKEENNNIYVRAGAGVKWNDLVQYCITNNYGGIENLILIPGNCGAAPMQNIGAYGVELKDAFYELTAYDYLENSVIKFSSHDCDFRYRDSVFKRKYKGQYVILDIVLRLQRDPVFNISYTSLEKELERMRITDLSLQSISQAVINIRTSKLPDPEIIGNAGSFFKNPEISQEEYHRLVNLHPGIIGFGIKDNKKKIAAGWLIEQCGYKGYRNGDAGCYEKQALVLVNYGGASGKDIFNLSEQIIHSVFKEFKILLEREVNII